jgi:hypothetical protein
MGTRRAFGRIGALAMLPLAGLACGTRAAIGGADAGSSSRRSYDLTASLILDSSFDPQGQLGPGKAVTIGPFTVSFDPQGLLAIVGGGGEA